MKVLVACGLLGLAQALPGVKMASRNATDEETGTDNEDPGDFRYISEETLSWASNADLESMEDIQGFVDKLSPEHLIVDKFNKLYDNHNPMAYIHNHGQGSEVKFNKIGKDYSERSTITKVTAKIKCVDFCQDVIGLLFLSRSEDRDKLKDQNLTTDQKNAMIKAKDLELRGKFPEFYNGLFNTCEKPCITAYRQPKATDLQWQRHFADQYLGFLNEHPGWNLVI